MDIPDQLGNLLHQHTKLRGPVLTAADKFTPWLKANRVTFFPEYTDHSIEHVQSVLSNAEGLLSETTWEILTAEDAAVLILAIILHDSAMHLSLDGFLRLIDPTHEWPIKGSGERFLKAMSDPPWPDLWDDFLREASRFDQQKLVELFGKPEPILRPPATPGGWRDEDYKLVGEFLRRHHARLAHEIALSGVPGPGPDLLELSDLEPWLKDVAGLVARSHNLDLRMAVELLHSHDHQEFRGVHIPLLMTAVRVSDYLELQADRAPGELLKVRQLRSPVSKQAWKDHSAVKNIKVHPDDPESVWIDAEPKNAETFLSLRRLLDGLQYELDACWAVLGEVYRGDRRFGLRVRRVRSTLDDVSTLSEHIDYVPVRASFEAAGGDLLKLLVDPLYEHHPAYGIRELMQNAVDACRELQDLRREHPAHKRFDVADLEADVVMSLRQQGDETSLIVEDRGIGMSPEIIVNYFLRVGASFRSSESWHQIHTDERGRPRVVRSGRFGVGALAAFLLGDEIEVETRHFDQREDRGVKFTARLEDPQIELRWCSRPIGTRIKTRITRPDVLKALEVMESWDWYRLKHPSVTRIICLDHEIRIHGTIRQGDATVPAGQEIRPPHGETVPHGLQSVHAPWRRLHQSALNDVLWCLHEGEVPGWQDICNGIALKMPDASRSRPEPLWPPKNKTSDLVLFRPRLSVLDPSGLLSIDLRRTRFTDMSILWEPLTNAVCRDILASVLVRAAGTRDEALEQIAQSTHQGELALGDLWHPGISGKPNDRGGPGLGGAIPLWLFVMEDGITLEDPALLRRASSVGVCIISPFSRYQGAPSNTPRKAYVKALARIPPKFGVGYQSDSAIDRKLQERRVRGGYESFVSFVAAKHWDDRRYSLGDFEGMSSTVVGNGWVAAHEDGASIPHDLLDHFAAAPPERGDFQYSFYLFSTGGSVPEPRNPLSRLWLDVLKSPFIPFDQKSRRNSLSSAFEELSEEVDLWEKVIAAKDNESVAAASYWINPRWSKGAKAQISYRSADG